MAFSRMVAVDSKIAAACCYDELVDMLDDVRVSRGLSFEALEELSPSYS